jgi:hypothetical protein
MYPDKVKGRLLSEADMKEGSPGDEHESLSLMLERLHKERAEAFTKQQKLRRFLHAFKLAAKQVRSVSARPGITPTEEETKGLSYQQQKELERDRVLAAINVIKEQLDATTGLSAAFIKRCKLMEQGDRPYDHGMDWEDPVFLARLNDHVSSLVSDMWLERKEASYSGKFIDFVEFTLREIRDHHMDEPPQPEVLENMTADRFLILHKAFLDVDEALYTMHPSASNSWYSDNLYRLVFGVLADGDSVIRTQSVMNRVVIPLTEKCCASVVGTLADSSEFTDKDKAILYKAMLSHVSRDTSVVIRHEGKLFLNSLSRITPAQRKVYVKENGAFVPWLFARVSYRLDQFYPVPGNMR